MMSVAPLSLHMRSNDDPVSLTELTGMLDNTSTTSRKISAMRSIVSRMSKGEDVASCFPQVVNNSSDDSTELRKLVYLFLMHYAVDNHELALLSINSFQVALKSSFPRARADAIRAMSSIRVTMVLPLVQQAIHSSYGDGSAYVRKSVALSLPKLKEHYMRNDNLDEPLAILKTLVGDQSLIVFPSALQSLHVLFPGQHLELLHPYFRYYCTYLPELDSASAVTVLEILLQYSRLYFTAPLELPLDVTEIPGDSLQQLLGAESEVIDSDLLLLFSACKTLLSSPSPSVIIAAVKILFYIAPSAFFAHSNIVQCLIRTVHCTHDYGVKYILLTNVLSLAQERPQQFASSFRAFFVSASDPEYLRQVKLDIIVALSNQTNASHILAELRSYLFDIDPKLVTIALQCIGRIGVRIESVAETCMSILMHTLQSSTSVVADAVIAVRQLLQAHPSLHSNVIPRLITMLDVIRDVSAKSSVVWIVGEYRAHIVKLAPDVLRKLARSFKEEATPVKLQIVNLASKLYADVTEDTEERISKVITLLFNYVLELADFDKDMDLRDRSRSLRSIYFTDGETAQALRTIRARAMPVPSQTKTSTNNLILGSLSHAAGHVVGPSYTPLPNFPEIASESSLRDPPAMYTYRGRLSSPEPPEARKSPRRRAMGLEDFFSAQPTVLQVEEEHWSTSESDTQDPVVQEEIADPLNDSSDFSSSGDDQEEMFQ